MKFKTVKREIKSIKRETANIALGYKEGLPSDIYKLVVTLEDRIMELTHSKHPKVVLFAHVQLQECRSARQLLDIILYS